MDIIEMTRELGKAMQADDRYIAYTLAKQANDEDEQLQNLIQGFNLNRMQLQMEAGKEEKNEEITTRMVSQVSQQIEQYLTKMAEIVEIPLG
jgi:cell fate (sporulation/competence/biofilm development) regulator YlbF (YheA/YmcA/DUF963 family)